MGGKRLAAGHGMDKKTKYNRKRRNRLQNFSAVGFLFLSYLFREGRLGEGISGDHGLADCGMGKHGGFHLGTGQPGVDTSR